MSIIRKALEAARHEMSFLNGLRVTDIPDAETTWLLDTRDTAGLLDQAIESLGQTEQIADKLGKIAEQLELANALKMLSFMPNMSDFKLVWDWQDEGENSGDGAPEKGKKQRLIPLAVCRIIPGE